MIDPNNADKRARFARSLEQTYQELQRFARMRDNTVKAYLGFNPHTADWDWAGYNNPRYQKSLPKGNLLQMAGLSHQIALAYGEPEFLHTARVPRQIRLAQHLESATNRMAKLLNLGEIARAVAADSFFGYGIFKVGVGVMPLSAQNATGLLEGPAVWRVGQKNFIYDIDADSWDNASYIGDMYPMALDDAIERFPEAADRLNAMTDVDRLDAKHVLPRASRYYAPEDVVWLIDVYFPKARVIATWPIRNESFSTVSDAPIMVRDYDGHWSGIYEVLNHMYSPDELVPIAQAESVKSMHYLFQDIFHLTAEQARNAKVNPLYQQGDEKDMRKIWDARDRHPVGVRNLSNVQLFEVPGPSATQTQYMAVLMNMFKQFVPAVDEPQRAPTATQGALMRQTTNAIIAEARRKFNRALQQVGYKLGHLLMTSNDLVIPASRPLRPGSNILVDFTWDNTVPRGSSIIDDFDLNIEPYSTVYRSPEERQAQLFQASQQIAQLMQLRAMGSPINIEAAVDTIARYSGLPELKTWYEELDPMYAAEKSAGRTSVPRIGVGQYTRHNVSEETTAGALEQSLTQGMSEESTTMPRME